MHPRRYPDGLIDPHVHTAPDAVPRLIDDLEMARAADDAGYRALVLKSHHTVTAARATMAEQHTRATRVFGGVVLNLHATGGINPLAVDTALKLGATVVWLPTFTSANQQRVSRQRGVTSQNLKALGDVEGAGVEVLEADGRLRTDVCEVLDLLAAAGVTLATGHVGPVEIMAVVPEAIRRGVPNVMITHPELSVVGLTIEQQLELAQLDGVWFERVLVVTLPTSEGYPLASIAENVRIVGADTTILATDLGQPSNPHPVQGMYAYIDALRELGVSQDDIELMACVNPAQALGLPPA